MNREIKQEASIPVQTRVNLVALAELDYYWESEGFKIRTMSQLISWSMDLLSEILETNTDGFKKFKSVADAHSYLAERQLYQRSMQKRSFKKISSAIAFENLRAEGVKPKDYVPQQYNILHNKRSVNPLEGESPFIMRRPNRMEVEKAVEIYKQLEAQGSVTKQGMTRDDAEEFARKDAEKQAAEKALMDDFLNKQKER